MERINLLKKKIENYLKKGQLVQNDDNKQFEKLFLKKARKNITVASLLFKISDEEDIKKLLKLSSDFETYDWTIVASYYAMYVSALAAIAKLGMKSESHAATIAVLEYNYVHKNKVLEKKDIQKLSDAHSISKELITKLLEIKGKRETAQYDATPAISREIAISASESAKEFVTKIEEVIS